MIKISEDILRQIQYNYTITGKLSIPYMQRKWKLSAEMAGEVVKHLTAGMKK